MSGPVLLAVAGAGGVGALARFWLDGTVSARVGRALPFGTLAVNLTGALLLGVLSGLALAPDLARIVSTGLVGAYTTFSTWAFESHRLGEDGQGRWALANVVVSVIAGVILAELGRRIGTGL